MTAEARKLDVARLVREHQVGLWRYLRLLGAGDAEAEDLVQETFLAIVERPFTEVDARATGAYLRRVAKHRLISQRRRDKARPALVGLECADEVWAQVAGEDDGEGYVAALRECLAGVTGRAERAILARYRDGQSRAEIGQELSMTDDGVKTLLRRTRAALRECVERKRKP